MNNHNNDKNCRYLHSYQGLNGLASIPGTAILRKSPFGRVLGWKSTPHLVKNCMEGLLSRGYCQSRATVLAWLRSGRGSSRIRLPFPALACNLH